MIDLTKYDTVYGPGNKGYLGQYAPSNVLGEWQTRTAPTAFLGKIRQEFLDVIDQEPVYEIW